jgi:hypothetical protein
MKPMKNRDKKKRKRKRMGINVEKMIDMIMMRELDKKGEKEFEELRKDIYLFSILCFLNSFV